MSYPAVPGLQRRLFLSIETIHSQHPALQGEILSRENFKIPEIGKIKPAVNLKDPAKITENVRERTERALAEREALIAKNAAAAEEALFATADSGWFGHIGAVGFAIEDDAVDGFAPIEAIASTQNLDDNMDIDVSQEGDNLNLLLQQIDERIGVQPILVGHGIKRIASYIFQRCIVTGVPIPWWLKQSVTDCRKSGGYSDDIALMAGSTLPDAPWKKSPSLNDLCRAMNFPQVIDADAWSDMVVGCHADLVRTAMNKAQRTRRIWRRLQGLPQLGIDASSISVGTEVSV